MPSPRRRVSGLMMGKGGSGCGHSTGARIGRSSSGAKCVCARRRRRSDASRRQGSLGDPCPQAGAEGTHYGRNGLRARGRAVLPFRSRFRCVERAHPVSCARRRLRADIQSAPSSHCPFCALLSFSAAFAWPHGLSPRGSTTSTNQYCTLLNGARWRALKVTRASRATPRRRAS